MIPTAPWSSTHKILFRFAACYFFLFCMSNQFVLSFAFEALWDRIIPPFGKIILDKKITALTSGSGDTTYNYLSLLLYVILSLVATFLWFVLDKKRNNYDQALLEGIHQNDTLKILLQTKREESFLLLSRKFNWVSESPFNR